MTEWPLSTHPGHQQLDGSDPEAVIDRLQGKLEIPVLACRIHRLDKVDLETAFEKSGFGLAARCGCKPGFVLRGPLRESWLAAMGEMMLLPVTAPA